MADDAFTRGGIGVLGSPAYIYGCKHFVLEKLENTVLISIKIAAKTELLQNVKIGGFCDLAKY